MKLRQLLPILLALVPTALFAADQSKNCGCACCKGKEVCCCHAKDAAEAAKPADDHSATAAKHYPIRGVIVAVRAADGELLVKHEDIPGLMRAMTMPFKVAPAALAIVKKGDRIAATLVERDGDFWLEEVRVSPADR